jgi:anti-anti-sigma factor
MVTTKNGLTVARRRGASGGIIVRPEGELDFSNRDSLYQSLTEALQAFAPFVVLDLRGLGFMDSAGVHAIWRAHSLFERSEVRFVILPAPPRVQRVFQLAGIESKLNFVTTASATPIS